MAKDVLNGVTLPSREEWDCIAFDLALLQKPAMFGSGTRITFKNICATYEVTEEVLNTLMQHKDFQFLLRRWDSSIERLGDKAPVILRAQIMASSMTERAYHHAMNSNTDVKDFVKIWEIMLALAGHDTKGAKNQQGPIIQANGAGVVYVNVPPNIPGMEHVYGGSDKRETERIIELDVAPEPREAEVVTSE